MSLTEKQCKELLALYGTEIEQWPENLRTQVMQSRCAPFLGKLVIEQQYVDEVMLSHRHFAPCDPDLSARIIHAARTIQRSTGFTPIVWLQEFLSSVFPRPAVALAAMLTLGVAIGFGLPFANNGDNTILQPYMEDDGAIL